MKKENDNVFWYTLKDPTPGEKLVGQVSADVVIVGGGMAGLSCAQKLSQTGLKIILVEKDFCGAGASGKTSGFITPDSEIELSSLIASHGKTTAKKIWEFVLSGVDTIRKNIEQHNISCDYQVQDSLFIASSPAGIKYVKEEHDAREALGYESKLYNKEELSDVIGSKKYNAAVRYSDTFGMNSYLYCQALRDIVIKSGVKVYENTPVTRIHSNGIDTENGSVIAKHIVVCGDRFIPDMGVLKKEIYHVQTFLGMSKPLSEIEVKKVFEDRCVMVWDTELVYNYFRITGDNRILLGGGDIVYTYAHKISNNTARFKRRLLITLRKSFQALILNSNIFGPECLV